MNIVSIRTYCLAHTAIIETKHTRIMYTYTAISEMFESVHKKYLQRTSATTIGSAIISTYRLRLRQRLWLVVPREPTFTLSRLLPRCSPLQAPFSV